MEKYRKGEPLPVNYTSCVCAKRVSGEASCDVDMPDYQMAVRKLLSVRACVEPGDGYGGDGLDGNVSFIIIYAADDGEIYSCQSTAGYRIEIPTDNDAYHTVSYLSADSVTGRVVSPRKISVKAKLTANVLCLADAEMSTAVVGESGDSLCSLEGEMKYTTAKHISDEPFLLSDEIIPEQRPGEIRVVSASGKVMINDTVATESGVVCRGELSVKMLLCREGQSECESITRKTRFTRELECDDIGSDSLCMSHGVCRDVNVTVGEGRIVCDSEIILEAFCMKNMKTAYIKDVYSTDFTTETDFGEYATAVTLACRNGNITQSGVFDAAENHIPGNAVIVDSNGYATVEKISCEKGRAIFTGETRYTLIYKTADGYASKELTQPYRYETELQHGACDGDICGTVCADIVQIRVGMDGERVSVDSELSFAFCLYSEEKYLSPKEVRLTGTITKEAGKLRAVYPALDGSLWEIAKTYHVDAERAANENSLKNVTDPDDVSSIAGVKYLIV